VNHRPYSSTTAFQNAQIKFVTAVSDARETLGEREFDALLEVLTILVARLNAERLWREERP
jgi:hypothetical protein